MELEKHIDSVLVEKAAHRGMCLHYKPIDKEVMVGDIEIVSADKRIVKFRQDNSLLPIIKEGMKHVSREYHSGAYVLYEPPLLTVEWKALEGHNYISTYKGVEHSDGTSFCVVSVFKFTKGRKDRKFFTIVAEKIYRIYGENAQYRNNVEALKLAALYGCKLCPETSNNNSIITHAKELGWYDMLAKCPIDAINVLCSGARQKYDVGVHMTPQIITKLQRIYEETLMTVVNVNESEEEIMMIDQIDSEYFLDDIVSSSYEKNGVSNYMYCFFIICLFIKQRIIVEKNKLKIGHGGKEFELKVSSENISPEL